jgi:hypothetical protein
MQLARSDNKTPAIWRNWLRSLPALTGKSLTAIAKECGIAVTTLTRPLRDDDPGTSGPNQSTIQKIVGRYHVTPPDFGTGAETQRRPLRGLSEDAVQYTPAGPDPLAAAVAALLAGHPNAFPWVIKTRVLELAGYLPGDVVIVDLGVEASPGDAVCAQVNIDWKRGTAETAMRIYERAGASHVLVAASMDPSLRQPIAVDDRVAVKGVIIGMVRPPMSRAA